LVTPASAGRNQKKSVDAKGAPPSATEIRAWALLLQIKQDELELLDEHVFWTAVKLRGEEKDADRRHIAELVRGGTLRIFNLLVQKKSRIDDPAKFWRMPWDKDLGEENNKVLQRLDTLSDEDRHAEAMDFLKRINNG